MTKAKLMMTLIGLAAALSLAFAFETKKFSGYFIYTGTIGSGSCTTFVSGRALSNTSNAGDTRVAASTASTTTNCPDLYTFAVSD